MRIVLAFAVMVVPATATAFEELADDGRFDGFIALMDDVGAASDIEGPATLFLPTDEAFRRVPKSLLDAIGDDPRMAERLHGAHVVPGDAHEADDLPGEMRTLGGDRLVVTYTLGELTLRLGPDDDIQAPLSTIQARAANEARIVRGDVIELGRGNIRVHALDTVLLPVELAQMQDATGSDRPTRGAAVADRDRRTEDDNPHVAAMARSDDGATPPLTDDDTITRTVPLRRSDLDAPETASQEPTLTVAAPRPSDPSDGATETPAPDTRETADRDARETAPPDDPGMDLVSDTISLTDLLGQPARTDDGEEIGSVEDIIMALDTLEIVAVVISSDGFLGIGGGDPRRVAIADVSIDPLTGAVVVPANDGD